jgi:hypothetical protein
MEVLHQSGYLLSIYMPFSGSNFLSYPLSIYICTPSLFGLVAVGPILLFTGIDRLLAVSLLSL